jgi:hypothetical protein
MEYFIENQQLTNIPSNIPWSPTGIFKHALYFIRYVIGVRTNLEYLDSRVGLRD